MPFANHFVGLLGSLTVTFFFNVWPTFETLDFNM